MALENNQTLRVNLIANTAGMAAGLSTASQQLQAFSNKARVIGRNLTTSLTLPMALVGGAAIKSALSFDKSMTKIKTLVGVASSEVDSMRGTVKRMAADTGVGANDAADALFFITSAGLRGSDALKVLEASSKASAIGLGEVKTVADAVTSAVNAYGIENLSAEGATDVLTAAVREGKLEADSLAQSMGKVLPVSSQLGVRFDEVGAALAAMSRTGTDAAMASTSLRGILSSLMNPSSQAKEQLEKMGLSAQELRTQLKEEGLLATLKTLTESFGDNQEAAGLVFGNVRALTGVLDLMGKNVGDTEEIFARMTDTTGTTQKGFEELQNSLEFKFRKTWNQLKTSFTELGQTLAVAVFPAIQKAVGFVTTLINKFNNLDTDTQNLILTLAGIAAALGPAILVVSGLAAAFALLTSPIVLISAGVIALVLALEHVFTNLKVVQLQIAKFAAKSGAYFVALGKKAMAILNKEKRNQIDKDLDATLAIIDSKYDPMIAVFDNAGESILEKISTAVSGVMEDFKSVGAGIGTAITDGISEGVENTGWSVGEKVKEVVTTAVGGSFGSIGQMVSQFFAANWEKIEENARKMEEFAQSKKRILEQAMASIITELVNQMVAAFQGGFKGIHDFAGKMLGIIGDLAIRLGTFVITAAIAVGNMLDPIKGIGAGLALIAIGAAMKGMQKGIQSGGLAREFADGGLVFGPTQALIGEYPGARSNPEVVAPLNKLKNYIGGRSGNENMMVGEFTLRGQDLVVALQRAERNRNRFK